MSILGYIKKFLHGDEDRDDWKDDNVEDDFDLDDDALDLCSIAEFMENEERKNPDLIVIKSYANNYNRFARKITLKFAEDNINNIILSPISILLLLAIAADAAKGRTREEIANVLSDTMSFEEVRDLLCKIQALISQKKMFVSANAVCVSHAIKKTISKDYVATLQKRFGGELFTDNDCELAINKWVKKMTYGMIDNLQHEEISTETVALLLNAIAFQACWEKKFREELITPDTFKNADDTSVNIPMLHSKEDFYIEDGNYEGFLKPYYRNYSFMALLPKKAGSDNLIAALQETDFTELFSKRIYHEVKIKMPEFSCLFEKNLRETCQELGIQTAFTDEADFSEMTNAWLKVGFITHKALIELDRNGTRASSVTDMGLRNAGKPIPRPKYKTVFLTRPFIYAIIHNKTGLPVFTGVLNRIKNEDGY